MSDQSITLARVMTEEASFKGHNTAPNTQDNNKALSGHQPQGVEAAGASEEGMGIIPESYIAYSVVKTRDTLQEHVRSPFRSKRRLPKQVLHTASCYSPYIPKYIGNQPAASVASASHSQTFWAQLPLPPPLPPTHTRS
jgi:hypothetical protein